jgi:hypothetical protein
MLSLGSYPEVSLADARGKRDEALALLANGINPSDQKKQDSLVAELAGRNTFGAIAEEHVQRLEESGVSEATVNKKPLAANSLRGELQPQSNKTFDGITAVFGIQNSLISLKQCAPDRRHFLHQSYS